MRKLLFIALCFTYSLSQAQASFTRLPNETFKINSNGTTKDRILGIDSTKLLIFSTANTYTATQTYATGSATISPINIPAAPALLTTPVNGSIESDGQLYYTSGGIRYRIPKVTPYNASPSPGQLLIAETGGNYTPGNIVAGTGITVTPASGNVTISATQRTAALVSSSFTMSLSSDYLNTTATQYTLTLPTTTGFTTDGSKIITVLATGTGGVIVRVPSGYAMQAGSSFATTTGTGGATLTQGQKVQIIPVGTNSYYLQPLNGSVTLY